MLALHAGPLTSPALMLF